MRVESWLHVHHRQLVICHVVADLSAAAQVAVVRTRVLRPPEEHLINIRGYTN